MPDSVRFPDSNLYRGMNTGFKLEIPETAAKKAANQGYTIGCFVSPPANRVGTLNRVFWGRLNGDTTGSTNNAAMSIGASTTHFSSGSIVFSAQPAPGSTIELALRTFTFVASGATGNQVNIGVDLATTLASLVTLLNSRPGGGVDARISEATHAVTGGNTLTITYKTVGANGDLYTLVASPASNGTVSGPTLLGGDHLLRFVGRSAAGVIDVTSVGQPNPIYLYPNRRYFVALIVTAVNSWIAACEVGGTAQVQLLSSNNSYAQVHTAAFQACIRNLGGPDTAVLSGWTGTMSDVFLLQGDFPLVASAPDLTLIQNIANRTQPINDALHNLFSPKKLTPDPNSPRFYYRLNSPTDFADAFGVQANCGINTNAALGANRTFYISAGLDMNPLRPRDTIDHVSQCVFGTPISSTTTPAQAMLTATTTIGTDSGTYAGITPNNIQARLIDAITGAELYARRVVDPAPSGGTWAENENAFTNVVMRAGWMVVQYRAYGAGDVPLTDWCTARGMRAAGFNLYSCGQSGLQVPFEGSASGVPSVGATVNGMIVYVKGHMPHTATALDDWGRNFQAAPLLTGAANSGANSVNLEARWGPKQFLDELDQLFPGVPASWMSLGESGMAFSNWDPSQGNLFPRRFTAFKAAIGVKQPFLWVWMAHNASPGNLYDVTMANVLAHANSILGAPIRNMHTITGRGAIPSNTPLPDTFLVANYSNSQEMISLEEVQQFCRERNSRDHWFMGMNTATESIAEQSGTGSDSHTGNSAKGGGRFGTTFAYYVLSGCRAIPDVPMKFQIRADGNDAVVSLVPGVVL